RLCRFLLLHSQADIEGFKESDNSFGIDQVEISWLFNFDAVTAQIDLEYEDGDEDNEDGVEQAFVNYALGNGDVITAGRYASMLGFEAYEPTGLYQYSTAYSLDGTAITLASQYVQGVKYTRSTDTTFFGISLQDQAFGNDGDRLGGDVEGDSSYAVEVAGSIDLGNGFTVFAGGAFEDADSGDNQLLNVYVTYETGAWLFAAELNLEENESEFAADLDINSGLLMANYAYSDVASVTARISMIEIEIDGVDLDFTKYTVAHNYALSDNLLLVTEVSYDDGEFDGDFDGDNLTFAAELLFSF
ncbi:MAG: hypothetical protein ABS34_13880, partial [Opitutaceae bacterium BACL24 MAG-120322-bin51]